MAGSTNSSDEQSRWRRLWELFDHAQSLSELECVAFLSNLEQSDDQLATELKSLLEAGRHEDSLLDRSIDELGLDEGLTSGIPDRIGPYRITQELGRGGMGEVYLGVRDDDEFQQQVAIKLAPIGRYSEEALRRFLAERQILSDLNHPNIARLFDGGTTDDGIPFLVMEYIDGDPIDVYCRQSSIHFDERLRLFAATCRAVHFAHNHLIVHRDIKPGNVLVDRNGQPKLLDFGVAKLLSPEGQGNTPVTQTVLRMATPEYASPEQLRGDALSTATDIYSLGVLLYQLMTGQRPYSVDTKDLKSTIDVICNTQPLRPSQAPVTDLGRRSRNRLRGDLDNIALMALRKDPQRRYASAEAFAQDIDHHLNGQPVHARAESTTYRVQKFVTRHPVGVALAASVLTLLVAFTLSSVNQARKLSAALAVANLEKARSAQVSEFLSNLFKLSDPVEGLGGQISAREIVDSGARQLNDQLSEQPDIQAGLQATLGKVYTNLAEFKAGEALLRIALDKRIQQGASLSERQTLSLDLAENLIAQSRNQEALTLLEPLLDKAATLDPKMHSSVMLGITRAYGDLGQLTQAESMARAALDLRLSLYGEVHSDVAAAREVLAITLWRRGDFPAALAQMEQAQQIIIDTVGPDHAAAARSLYMIGIIQDAAGLNEEAELAFRSVIELRGRLFGERDLRTADAINALGARLYAQGRYEEARPLLERSIDIEFEAWGGPHPSVVSAQTNLALIHVEQGDYGLAIPLLKSNLEITTSTYGPNHLSVGYALNNLGLAYQNQRALNLAAQHFEQAHAVLLESWGDSHPGLAYSLNNLAQVAHDLGETDRAERLAQEGLALRRASLAADDPATAASLQAIGRFMIERGAFAAARPLVAEALAIRQQKMAPGDWRTGEAQVLNAVVMAKMGEREGTKTAFEQGELFMQVHLPSDHWRLEYVQRYRQMLNP